MIICELKFDFLETFKSFGSGKKRHLTPGLGGNQEAKVKVFDEKIQFVSNQQVAPEIDDGVLFLSGKLIINSSKL